MLITLSVTGLVSAENSLNCHAELPYYQLQQERKRLDRGTNDS